MEAYQYKLVTKVVFGCYYIFVSEGISIPRRGAMLVRTCPWVLFCARVLVFVAARPRSFMCGEASECGDVGRMSNAARYALSESRGRLPYAARMR